MSFYHFTSSDSGAPTLNGVNGAMVTVLDWVLVTKGGWTKDYSGTNKAIYRPPSGNRFVLRVVHDSAVSGNAGRVTVRGAESASAIDTITDAFPTTALVADTSSLWPASSTADSTARVYWGVVTDTCLVMFVKASGTNVANVCIFGDVEPQISTDAYNTVINVSNATSAATSGIYNNAAGTLWWARNIDGSVKSSQGRLMVMSGSGASSAVGNLSHAAAYPHAFDSKVHHKALAVSDMDVASAASGPTIGTKALPVRGHLRQLREPLHAGSSVTSKDDTFTDTSYNASARFSFASASTSSGSWMILEETDTWTV